MKITIEVDCTPEEARKLAGLPDVGPLQEEIMAHVRDRVLKAMSLSDPETLMKAGLLLSQESSGARVAAEQKAAA